MRRIAFLVAALVALPLFADPKNVKVLTGLSDFELNRTMQVVRASLGVGCDYCHAPAADGKGLDFASDAKKEKQTARKMMEMVKSINAANFDGRMEVSCFTCHRGSTDPVGILPLPQPLPPEHHAEAEEQKPAAKSAMPTRDEIVARYASAIGKPSAAVWESRRITGTREGSDGKPLPITIEEAPGVTHIVVKLDGGTMEQAATTSAGWARNAKGVRPFGAFEQTMFTALNDAFAPPLPEAIPQDARAFRRTRDGHDVDVIFFRRGPGTRERLEFDPASGLLLRRTILVDTPAGVAPTEADFEDWRAVDGVKYPFTIKVMPYTPQFGSTRRYSEVVLGARVDPKIADVPK